jgi:hypothetical protein
VSASLHRWVNLVENNADPARQSQFNDWYDNLHLPDALCTPGFARARRYERQEFRDGRAQYLAVYEIDSADIDETMRVRRAVREEEVKKGRASTSFPHLSYSLWRDILCQQLSERTAPGNAAGKGKWLSLVESNCDPRREAEFNDWCEQVQVPESLGVPGYVSARRLRIKEFRDGRGKYMTVCEIESDDIAETIRARNAVRARTRPDLEWPLWREIFWRQISDKAAGK